MYCKDMWLRMCPNYKGLWLFIGPCDHICAADILWLLLCAAFVHEMTSDATLRVMFETEHEFFVSSENV